MNTVKFTQIYCQFYSHLQKPFHVVSKLLKTYKDKFISLPVILLETVYQWQGMRLCQPESERRLLEEKEVPPVLLIPANKYNF